jgi:hypothetical protein
MVRKSATHTGKVPSEVQWPQYLLERASAPPPEDCAVVPASTPVISFGHPLNPEVATLGINPSSGEFLDRNKDLLSDPKRRLATLESIGVSHHGDIDRIGARRIIDDCANYFERRPYGWFNALDQVLSAALDVSYFDKTACHLDLVQWATDPVWQGLEERIRARLLSADRDFLVRQLRHEGYRLIAVAGRTACRWVERAGLVKWEAVAVLEEAPSATFYVGDVASPRFVAWSCNLQSQPGARRHIPHLIALLRTHAQSIEGATNMLEDASVLAKGTHFRTRQELLEALEQWLQNDEETVGDATRFGRAPWISFETPAGIADLNADTNRRSVERMLHHAQTHPGAAWHVVENRRGKVNKVVFDLNDTHESWYAYLREPSSEPRELE